MGVLLMFRAFCQINVKCLMPSALFGAEKMHVNALQAFSRHSGEASEILFGMPCGPQIPDTKYIRQLHFKRLNEPFKKAFERVNEPFQN